MIDKLAQESRIHLRTGCFCNIGACQIHLPHLNKENFYFSHGHKCGDHIDLIENKPTGAIRISFGYCSIKNDCDALIEFLKSTFVEVENTQKSTNIQEPKPQNEYFKITSLFIYPIKSCAPMKIEQRWPLIQNGFLHDRNWIIVDCNNVPLSQKRVSKLTSLKPRIDLDRKLLEIHCENDSYNINLDLINNRETIAWIGKDGKRGFDEGNKASEWLTNMLGLKEPCRLIRCDVSVSNKADFLLINQNSVKRLNQFVVEDKQIIDNMDLEYLATQFRPNLVVSPMNEVDNCGEEKWSHIKILNKHIEFEAVENCTRCQMININQNFVDSKNENRKNTDFSSLLKQLYKLKSNSKFGIYLKREKYAEKSNFSEDYLDKYWSSIDNVLSIGDIGLAMVEELDHTISDSI